MATKLATKMRIPLVCCALFSGLAACETASTTSGTAPTDAASQYQVTSALFSENPALLFEAAKRACDGPSEEFTHPRSGVTQCRMLMTPEMTAAAILNFDGDIKDLPQLVLSLSTTRANGGYLVSGCAFVKVPRRNGKVARVVVPGASIDSKLQEMLASTGGKPVRDVPVDIARRCYSL